MLIIINIKEPLSRVLGFQWCVNQDFPQGAHYQLENKTQTHK